MSLILRQLAKQMKLITLLKEEANPKEEDPQQNKINKITKTKTFKVKSKKYANLLEFTTYYLTTSCIKFMFSLKYLLYI